MSNSRRSRISETVAVVQPHACITSSLFWVYFIIIALITDEMDRRTRPGQATNLAHKHHACTHAYASASAASTHKALARFCFESKKWAGNYY